MNPSIRSQQVVIIGGGYAGMLAAARAARSGKAAVTLIDAQAAFVQRIRLHEALAGDRPATLPYRSLLARRGISFTQGRVEGIDLQRGQVVGRSATGTPFAVGYDTLVLALGSTTAAPVPGVAQYSVRLNDLATTQKAHGEVRDLADRRGHVLVVGGGATGIEVAAELATRFPTLRVTLATGGAFADTYDPAAASYLRRVLAAQGVQIREQTAISALEAGQAHLADGATLRFDMCIWSGGFQAPPLARAAGLATDALGRLRVAASLQALERPEVYGVGDAAALPFGDGTLRMGCVTALPLGAHAGDNIARQLRGDYLQPFDMGFLGRNLSLGRTDGLIQMTDRADQPRPFLLTRRTGALVKELICRMTFEVVRWELRTALPLYRWPAGPVQHATLPQTAH